MHEPAGLVAPDEDRGDHAARAEPTDPGERVELLFGPPVGELVELHPVSGRDDNYDGRDDQGQGGGQIDSRPPSNDELDRVDKPASHDGDRDELEEPAPSVLAIGQPSRVQRVDAAEEIRDLQRDEEGEEGIDGQQHRRPGRRAQDAAQARQERREGGLGAAPRDYKEPAAKPREARGENDPADQLPDRPALEVEDVSERAREDSVSAREEKGEDDKERERQGDPHTNGDDAPAGAA